MVRVDLHVHTSASSDCRVAPAAIAKQCSRLGLGPVFITDHNTIAGAEQIRETARWTVVIGEEILTTSGELIGLFLTRAVRSGLSAMEAAGEVKAQGGLVYLEHPYDVSRRHLSEDAIEQIARQLDIVETYNGRSDDHANRRAEDLCATIGAAAGAGSDAHSLGELGSVYVEMEDFDGPVDFLQKLRSGRVVVGRSRVRLMAEARLRKRR